MGAQVKVYNLTQVTQHHGRTKLEPGEWTEVPYALASQLAKSPNYRVDDAALLGDYKFIDDGGRYLGWSSPMYYSDGYGSVGQEIAKTFLGMGVRLSIFPRDYDPGDSRFGGLRLDEWEHKAYVPRNVIDRLREPQDDCFYGFNLTWPKEVQRHPFVRGIGYTMFETTLPPREWAGCMNKCRRVVVPCQQNKQAFEDIGVTVPIHVVPLGVDPAKWRYSDERQDNPFGFIFLMSAGITHRKNPVAAAKAFVAAFPMGQHREQGVYLYLKTRGAGASGFRDWAKELPDDPRIRVIAEESTPSEMLAHMHNASAFIFPSRGEGFGLTPMQAMATGLPTIFSDNSGMSEYANPRYNYPIPCAEVPVPDAAHGGFPDSWGDCGNWWEPDFDAMVEAMREVYSNQSKAWAKGKRAAKWVRERWTLELTCRDLLDVVMLDAKESGIV